MRWIACAAVLTAAAAVACAQDTTVDDLRWQRLDDLPVGVIAPAASVSGQHMVVTGGLTLGGGACDLVQVMDLDQFRWTRVLHLTQPRFRHAQATLDDGRLLVVGGAAHPAAGDLSSLASCELIDLDAPPGSAVTTAADLPVKMPTPTVHKLDDGRVAAIGGWAATIYDPAADAWSVPIRLHQFRKEHASILIGPRLVLVVGGTGRSTFERIDLEAGESALVADPRLPWPLDDMALVRLEDGRLWVLGGQQLTGRTVDDTWLVALSAEGWPVSIADGLALGEPQGVSDQVLAETQWGVVAAGGEAEDLHKHDRELSLAFLLNRATLEVQRLSAMEVAHDDAAAVAWAGTIIVAGGQAPGSMLGVPLPTPVRAVEMLAPSAGAGSDR